MKYTIEYEAPANTYVAPDYAYGIRELKALLKYGFDAQRYPIKKITKDYVDGAGVDVTDKYIKPVDLCDIMRR